MADPYQNLPRGTPLNKISAGHISGWNEAARMTRGNRIKSEFGVGENRDDSTVVKVLNDSGASRDRFSVMRVASPIITYSENGDQFWNNPGVKVDEPGAASDQDVIAVLLDPLKDQAIGRAVILGLTPVKIFVDTGETAWKWADVTSGVTAHLVMKNTASTARVIWKESGTGGDKWALVCLLGPGNGGGGGSTTQTFVRIASTTKTSGRYPAKLATYDAGAQTWSDGADCWVVDANGFDLGLFHGEAFLVGSVSGVDVYMGSASLWDDGDCVS